MQSEDTQQELIIPGNPVSAGRFDPTAPPGQIVGKGSLHTGGLYLRAALDEMHRIRSLCESLEENHRELLEETKAQYRNLNHQKKELELLQKRRSIFKPFQFVAIRRAKRAFLLSAQHLWDSTCTTSEKLKRQLLSISSEEFTQADGASLAMEDFGGVITELPTPGEMSLPHIQEALGDAQAVATYLTSLGNPFAGPVSSNASEQGSEAPTETSTPDLGPAVSSARSSVSTSPGSPTSATRFSSLSVHISQTYNIVNNTNSNAPGLTFNNDSENTSGSTIEHANSLPS